MGTEGMKYSLVSREVIADSIETVAGCEGFDGLVAIGGCDKNMPGCLMAIARLTAPRCLSMAARSCQDASRARSWRNGWEENRESGRGIEAAAGYRLGV